MAETVSEAVASGGCKPETFLNHWQDIRDAKDEAAGTATAVARAKKAAKRDGVDLDVMKLVEKLKDMDDDEQVIFLNKARMYCGWLKMPLGAWSMDLVIPVPKQSSQADYEKWQAGQDGHAAGVNGSPREANPFAPGTDKYVSWDKKWTAGFKVNQRKLADTMVRGTGGARSRKAPDGAGATAH